MTADEIENIIDTFRTRLEQAQQDIARTVPTLPGGEPSKAVGKDFLPNIHIDPWRPESPTPRLMVVAEGMAQLPEGFTLHPKLARHYITRRDALQEGRPVDWAMAEGLAFGTLIQEGKRSTHRAGHPPRDIQPAARPLRCENRPTPRPVV